MFAIGEYVVCGNKGVCVVEKITTLNISGADKEREYYILKPVYSTSSTVYVPVDSDKESMRPVLAKEEAKRLVERFPEIPTLTITNEKFSEQVYKESMKTGKCEDWVRVLKTIYIRKEQRIQSGRKITAVDAKYFHLAEDILFGELAVALQIPKDSVEEYVSSCM